MAMGRGLTLQCGDDAVNLTRSWNTRETRFGAGSPKLGLSRKPDTSFPAKKHGGHFQLAANFQACASPVSQLITPASLMSLVANKGDKVLDAFEDAHSEEDDVSDDEESLCDDEEKSEDDDDDSIDESGSQLKGVNSFNYRKDLEEEEVHSSSDNEDDVSQETKDSDEEVEDAIEFILQERLEIEKRQFGFISLEDTNNQIRGKRKEVEKKERLIKPRTLSNTSSDKENINIDVPNISSVSSCERISGKTVYQNGITGEERVTHLVEKGILKESLKAPEKQNVTQLNVRKDFPTRPSVGKEHIENGFQGRSSQNREWDENQRPMQEISVSQSKKDTRSKKPIINCNSPIHQDTVIGKDNPKKSNLSPHAAPFVPEACGAKGTVQGVGTVIQDRVGPQTEPSLWSSEYDSQQGNSPQVSEVRRVLPKTKESLVPTHRVSSPLRTETSSKLSDEELDNEYEWRKYKLIRKVKQILKPQTSVDGKNILGDVSQLCNLMTGASLSFEIFAAYPKELVIILEEIIRQSVEETVLDDDYQKYFIELIHKLSASALHFDEDFKLAIKSAEKHFLKPFIGAHLEKLGLRFCQFLGRLYGSLCQVSSPTKETLEEIILALCKNWIIFNQKDTSLNGEVTELTYAKCLQAITKEIGPFCPQEKWKQLMGDVKGQIFSKRPQNVKEVFLEILLYSEGVCGSSSSSECVSSENVASNSAEEVSPLFESVIPSPSKVECATPKPILGGSKEKVGGDENLEQSSFKSQSEELNRSIDHRELVEHSKPGANTSRGSQSGSESTKRDSSPYHSPYNDSTKATYLSTKLKASSLPNKVKCIKSTWQPNSPVRKTIHGNEHPVSHDSEGAAKAANISKEGEPCDWWDFDAACKQKMAVQVEEERKRSEKESKGENGEMTVDSDENKRGTRQNPTDTNGEAAVAEGDSDQGIGMEIWDEELDPNPQPLMYPSATKRHITGHSLRFQQEQYQLNIGRAAKTYEVCVGDSGGAMLHNVPGNDVTGIQQSEDDVVILENSDSDDGDDNDDDGNNGDDLDDEVPMIWGDDLAGVPSKQGVETVPNHNVNTSTSGTIGTLSHPPYRQDINRSMLSRPWNAKPLLIFQEEEDDEPSLSQIEILAQKALAEKTHLTGSSHWQNLNLTTKSEVE